MHFRKQRVIVTVHLQLLHILEMAGSQALHPKLLSASAEIRHSSTANGCLKCLLIHICDHQHFLCLIVLDYNRHHAVAVFLQAHPMKWRIRTYSLQSLFLSADVSAP